MVMVTDEQIEAISRKNDTHVGWAKRSVPIIQTAGDGHGLPSFARPTVLEMGTDYRPLPILRLLFPVLRTG